MVAELRYTVDEAAQVLRCGRDKIFELIRTGELEPTVRDGRKRCVTRESVERRALESARPSSPRGRRGARTPSAWEPVNLGDLR